MAERYSRVFALTENLYTEGSPVVIAAGALQRDNVKNTYIGQLKLRSVSSLPIKTVKVRLLPADTEGKTLEGEILYEYLDLNVRRDEEFGQKSPIPIPDEKTRGFSAEVMEAVFADGSTWESSGAAWEALAAPIPLETALGDPELVKQFRLRFGKSATFAPFQQQGLWSCVCGTLSREDEAFCRRCGQRQDALLHVDLQELEQERDQRLAQEKAAREAAEKAAAEERAAAEEARIAAEKAAEEARIAAEKAAAEKKAARQEKIRKIKKILKIAVPSAVGLAVALLLVFKLLIPTIKYNKAVELAEAGQYDEAIAVFEALDGFKDSEEQIPKTKYAKAQAFLENGEYDAALAVLKELGDYEGAPQLMDRTNYEKALSLMEAGEYDEAIGILEKLGEYEDAPEQLEEARNAQKYENALTCLESGEDQQAYELFVELGNYRDAASYLTKFETRLHEVKTEFSDGSGHSTTYEYDNKGRVTKEVYDRVLVFSHFDMHANDKGKTRKDFVYGSSGNLVSTTEHVFASYSRKRSYPWSESDIRVNYEDAVTLYQDGLPISKTSGDLSITYSYTYFPEGGVQTCQEVSQQGDDTTTKLHTYNEQGQEIRLDYTKETVGYRGKISKTEYYEVYEYDEYGTMTGWTSVQGTKETKSDWRFEYSFGKNKEITESKQYIDGKLYKVEKYEDGRLLSIQYYSNGKESYTTTYTYDHVYKG